jgi:hypothetical protein
MAYDFLGLVNDVNRKLNEVELTSSNFGSATGSYSASKDAVNSALRYVNQSAFEWPFNHVSQEEFLTPGEVRYSYPSDAKTIDFDSFRIKRDAALGNETRKLKTVVYEDYLDKFVDAEYNTSNTGIRTLPYLVFRSPSMEYGVYPPPDKAYEIVYEYYRLPVDLINATDVPSTPEQFRYIIIDGAMYYAYMFRGNTQDAQLQFVRFEEGIKNMRTLYINRYEYVRDTRVSNSSSNGFGQRVN